MLKEFDKIFGRDLPSYNAITMKAMVWTATCCIVRICEMVRTKHKMAMPVDHNIKRENVTVSSSGAHPGISITFLSWESSEGARILFFPKMQKFKLAIKLLQRYLLVRPKKPIL